MTIQRKPWSTSYRSSKNIVAQLTMYDVFTDPDRQTIVSALLTERDLTVEVLADRLATGSNEDGVVPSETAVLHEHVLPMVDAELLTYDSTTKTVSLAPGVTFSLPSAPEDRDARR